MRECCTVDLGTVPYPDAFTIQKEVVERVQNDRSGDTLLFVEHPHVFSVGRNADGSAIIADRGLIASRGATIVDTDRGGDVTYHGPGQLVGYPILALQGERRDIRRFVGDLEDVLLRTLGRFDIEGHRHHVHRGVWTEQGKIASIGVRISRWVTCHGFALNINTDLSYFSMIEPCGIVGCEMTSMAKTKGVAIDPEEVKKVLVEQFGEVFERCMTFSEQDDSEHRWRVNA